MTDPPGDAEGRQRNRRWGQNPHAEEALAAKKPDLAASLVRAKAVADRLAGVTDALNEVIAQAEKAIASLRLGVPGNVLISMDEDDPYGLGSGFQNLLFTKEDKTWRLIVESGYTDDEGNWSYTPLVNANRSTRLAAIEKLPALVENMIERAEAEITEVSDKTDRALEFIKTLSARNGGGH